VPDHGLTVVIAEDAVLLREGIVRLLGEHGHRVLAAVGDGPSFVDAVARLTPDVSIVDVRMPPSYTDEGLRAAVAVAAGGTVLDPEVVAQLLVRRSARDPLGALTPREREVLALMAEGRSNTAIARRLVVSDGAVEKHVRNIFTKLDLPPDEEQHRRVLAVLAYLRS
jgi:DNA-binding NarL/FixJ family response regulator